MCTLMGVSSLSVVKGWMRKNRDETNNHMHTCLTLLYVVNGYKMYIMHAIIRSISRFLRVCLGWL